MIYLCVWHLSATASPKVIPFEKSKNLVQDEKLMIECKVLGYPKPSITWFKDNEEVKVSVHNKLHPHRFKVWQQDILRVRLKTALN